ncbi:MAG: DUF3540 domain-containing protein [Candidatus Electrothrix scaldis]|nr:MAG: DUF3540 domain-containing protein [Candidatus Electrothrix sp. GW3-3]
MTLPQQQQTYDEMFFTTGKVQQMLDRHYVINAGQRQIQALQATGCLLVPEPGDTVLLTEGNEEKAYIISVLNRSAKPARITLPENSVIAAQGGDLTLYADKQISLKSQEMHLQADRGVAEIHDTQFTGDTVDISVSRLRAIWSTMETRAERIFQRVTRLYRRIKTEDSRLEELHCSVENTCRIEARDISIEADERLRLDGERVEIG